MRMGITGYEPSFLFGIDEVRQAHGARLAALAGRRLTGFAVVRFVEDGSWYADCPVVLDFEGVRVEISHHDLNSFWMGWGEIDTTAALANWEWFELTPAWSDRDDRLAPFVGRELSEAALLEWCPPAESRDMARGTVAVEFRFGDDYLRIMNGLDENHVELGPAAPEHVRYHLQLSE
ncbi:hypothetical protein AB0I39_15670 [Kitasatospora purpeofusca]|uniref:hypothetical protein n=1 Tax=Kitasatospora purpeofusca TaxID=67352 RepID=UPI003410DC60